MAIPSTMTAVEISRPGGPEVLVPVARPVPKPDAGEVLIRVAAAGLNRPDCLQRQGGYPPPPGASDLPGLEVAGEVVAVGPAGPNSALPGRASWKPAACLPETFFTVWTNLFERARLQRGEVALIHGGSSGIGTTAIQLAHAFGARVFTTAGSGEKCQACRDLGAERAINHREEDFVDIVTKAAGGADAVLDMVGGSYFARNLAVLNTEGRLVQIAFLEGGKVALDLNIVMRKRLTVTGSTLRPRTPAQKGAIAAQLLEKVWPLIAEGKVKPIIYKTFPLREAATAHALMESGEHIGKIALTL